MAGYVIVIANPKGGVGKTTTALLLASTFDHYHLRVTVFDCDKQLSLYAWKEMNVTRSTFKVIKSLDDSKLYRDILEAKDDNDIIIVDVAGSKDFLFMKALARADLVIIPLQTSPLDAARAAETCAIVEEQAEMLKEQIPYVLLYTKTKVAMRTRLQVDLDKQLQIANVPVLDPPLADREAYKHLFGTGETLYEIDTSKVSNPLKALENAELLAAEVLKIAGVEVAPEYRTWVHTNIRPATAEPKPRKKRKAA